MHNGILRNIEVVRMYAGHFWASFHSRLVKTHQLKMSIFKINVHIKNVYKTHFKHLDKIVFMIMSYFRCVHTFFLPIDR